VDFEAFHAWRRLKIALYRKDLRRNVGNVFAMVDEDGGGTLDIEEVTQMMPKIKKLFKGVDFDPPFELERDFADMDKRGSGKEKGLVQTFAELDVAVSGVVTLSELRAAVVAKGNVSEDECEALFEICGAGKRKEITTTAFASGVKQWRRDNGEVSWDEVREISVSKSEVVGRP
jgi:Ca2+-binding EF-hand superfamily protein